MSQTFFRVSPISWVDLPPASFDQFGERKVAEATIGSTNLAFSAMIKEVKRDGSHTYTASLNYNCVGENFASTAEAKRYVVEFLQAYINSIIQPANQYIQILIKAIKAAKAGCNEIGND